MICKCSFFDVYKCTSHTMMRYAVFMFLQLVSCRRWWWLLTPSASPSYTSGHYNQIISTTRPPCYKVILIWLGGKCLSWKNVLSRHMHERKHFPFPLWKKNSWQVFLFNHRGCWFPPCSLNICVLKADPCRNRQHRCIWPLYKWCYHVTASK